MMVKIMMILLRVILNPRCHTVSLQKKKIMKKLNDDKEENMRGCPDEGTS